MNTEMYSAVALAGLTLSLIQLKLGSIGLFTSHRGNFQSLDWIWEKRQSAQKAAESRHQTMPEQLAQPSCFGYQKRWLYQILRELP